MGEWVRACPKCLGNDMEKVGWGYWYCKGCSNILDTSSGSPASVISLADASRDKVKKPKEPKRTETPEPGKWEEQKGMDFPL